MKRKCMLALALVLVAFVFPITVFANSYRDITVKVWQNGSVSESFEIAGMMPGDTIVQIADLTVGYKNDIALTCYFTANSTSSQELLDALQVKVSLPTGGYTVFEGTLAEFSASNPHEVFVEYAGGSNTVVRYNISIYLPEETGNECMNQTVTGDFVWICATEELPKASSDVIILVGDTPDTGEHFKYALVFAIAAVSGVALLLLVYCGRRKKDE